MARNRKPREKKITLARSQRQAPIPAEKLLWKALRNRAFAGFKFRRQHPIGAYVVDFASVECKLIIELDGVSHLSSRCEDEKRTRLLEAEGWLVLRFWNTEIYEDLEPVKEAIYRTCVKRTSESGPPSPPAPLPPPAMLLQTTSGSTRGERGGRLLVLVAVCSLLVGSTVHAQAPSYSKDIRPFVTKYCLECHNARTQKGTLSLETHKAMMDGADAGPVIAPGQPDKSKLVLLVEHKQKPTMPPAKAKYQPTKDEVALLRAWVKAGAMDDGANVKVELPAIKPLKSVLPPIIGVGYVPKFQQLLIANSDFLTMIDDLPHGPALKYPPRGGGRITALVVSAGGEIFLGTSKGQVERVLSADLGPLMDSSHKDGILDLAIEPKSRTLASAGYDTKVLVLDRDSIVAKTQELKEHSDAVYGLAFSPDGKLLASVSADRAMKVFDVETGKLLYTLGEATDWLYAVAWSPDGKYLVSGGVDKSIRVYEALRPLTGTGSPKLRQSVFAHEGAVQKLVFTGDSKTLYSVGEDRVVKAWDIEKMVERKVYDKQPETVMCLALREDAGQFIVGRYDGIVQLVDMKTGKVAHEFGGK
ncbi:MAG: DUF559 domain-containing protein, partial [Planctomycetes bacterium]|nr:DUF559 domain-containing protein [Planctomycetota bacterium]